MNWFRFLIVPLLAASAVAGESPQHRRRVTEQAVSNPGAVSRQGKYWVEEITGVVTVAPRVRIESSDGAIEVQGAPQQEISYRIQKRVTAGSEEAARRIFAEYPLLVSRRGETVELQVEGLSADYFVSVPKNTSMTELETRAGAVSARELEGSLRASSAGGAIDVDRIGGAIILETAGGSINMGSVGGRVRAETAGGGIRLASAGGEVYVATRGGDIEIGQAERSVHAQTAGGGIRIVRAGGDVLAESAGGNISVGEAGRVTAATAGGSIQVENARALVRVETAAGSIRLARCAGPVRAETAAGSIMARIAAARSAWAESLLETSVGDIIVYLPKDLAVTIRAAIEMARGSHRITSDFPLTVHSGEGPGPREITGEGIINGGGAQLRLRTISGNIEIRSQK